MATGSSQAGQVPDPTRGKASSEQYCSPRWRVSPPMGIGRRCCVGERAQGADGGGVG